MTHSFLLSVWEDEELQELRPDARLAEGLPDL